MNIINKLKKYWFFKFWEKIPWLVLNWKNATYAVINERCARAWAWIMLVLWTYAFINAAILQNYLPLKIIVSFFFVDFFIKTLIWTKFSPIGFISKLIISNQTPEYVWAIQKRFAWWMWLAVSLLMMFLIFVTNTLWPINMAICLMCLTFMWLETSFWICVWCKIYYWLMSKWLIKKPQVRPACPWWVCNIG